jgi:predicted nucleic acid-binding protein
MARIAIDTNVLVYSEGLARTAGDQAKIAWSRRFVEAMLRSGKRPALPLPCLSELHYVLVRKGGYDAAYASQRGAALAQVGEVLALTPATLDAAFGLSAGHGLQIFDALILAAAVEAQCELLVSEDMHDGFAWRGLVVTNPFGPNPDPRLARLVAATP